MHTDAALLFSDIAAVTGMDCSGCERQAVSGGDINEAWHLRGADGREWFLKLNSPDQADMFAAESEGLQAIANTKTVGVPEPLGYGATPNEAWLLLEWLPLGGGCEQSDAELGQQLAAMHQVTWKKFGWHRDNTIGLTPQSNKAHSDWVGFYRDERLSYQLRLAQRNGANADVVDTGMQLCERLPAFFHSYSPASSLLHGDLWSGNRCALQDGRPVIFDPAVYYGDRETDIAMTELFGGYGAAFYAAYNAHWQLDEGYEIRRDLYNLYHVLNHYNLFGGAYLERAENMMQRLLASV